MSYRESSAALRSLASRGGQLSEALTLPLAPQGNCSQGWPAMQGQDHHAPLRWFRDLTCAQVTRRASLWEDYVNAFWK